MRIQVRSPGWPNGLSPTAVYNADTGVCTYLYSDATTGRAGTITEHLGRFLVHGFHADTASVEVNIEQGTAGLRDPFTLRGNTDDLQLALPALARGLLVAAGER